MAWDRAAFDRRLLETAVEQGNARYDPAVELPAAPVRGIVYHSNLRSGTAHPLRDAFHYAGALLDHGAPEDVERAARVLRRALTAQDTDPESKTYGIWPWFWEEPLPQMSPPDWNWADFCGQALFFILSRHADALPDDVRAGATAALGHAARSIERRNMGPHYTNIAVLGTFVSLAASEYLGWEDLRRYAVARLQRFAEWTDRLGSFSEFNSPTYITVTITALSQALQYWRDEEAKAVAARIHGRAWQHVADHWHAPTRQWAGPHSRCYMTDLRANGAAQVMLQKGTAGAISFYGSDDPVPGSWEASLTDYHCPTALLPCFISPEDERCHTERFSADEGPAMPVVGTTYLNRTFALGSCSRLDLWNQRRPLLLYWGDVGPARSLRLQCLHDGFDFASAQFFSAQERGCVLAGVTFAGDGGDQHLHLDAIRNRTFRARDIRLRVEIIGAPTGCEEGSSLEVGRPLCLDLGGLRAWLCVPAAAFGNVPVCCQVTREGRALFLDVVLYSGPEKEIRWDEVGRAFAGLALAVGETQAELPTVLAEGDASVSLAWQSPAGPLSVSFDPRVTTVGEQQAAAKVSREH